MVIKNIEKFLIFFFLLFPRRVFIRFIVRCIPAFGGTRVSVDLVNQHVRLFMDRMFLFETRGIFIPEGDSIKRPQGR